MNGVVNLEEHLARLNRIGIALSAERDLHRLLATILQEARDFTHAEGGTLYSVEGDRLRFQATQNDALDRRGDGTQYAAHEVGQSLPLSRESMAGYVGLTGEVINLEDVYLIPPDRPYRFNPEFDHRHHYRTTSMLMVPMKEADGHILGVLQLINAMDPGWASHPLRPSLGRPGDVAGLAGGGGDPQRPADGGTQGCVRGHHLPPVGRG